jgi:hypothetical protein
MRGVRSVHWLYAASAAEIGDWFAFADRIIFATQVLWPGIRPPHWKKGERFDPGQLKQQAA